MGSVFSSDMNTCYKVATKLQTGQVYVNNYFSMDTTVPFGGFKQSGFGRELSHYGLDGFLESKTIVYDMN